MATHFSGGPVLNSFHVDGSENIGVGINMHSVLFEYCLIMLQKSSFCVQIVCG